MTVQEILAIFRRMLDEHWAYAWGADEAGTVDCAGAFVYAYRQHGLSIYQGSNRMARTEVLELLPVSAAKPGMMAFKAREPGDKYYDLPDGYKPGGKHYDGDLRDWHHVGLVDEDPRYVLNARSTADGFVRSRISDGWDAVGFAKQIDYSKNDDTEGLEMTGQMATVVAQQGKDVNMRAEPTRKAAVLVKVPIGARIEASDVQDEWARVVYNGRRGYMMTKFLDLQDTADPEDIPASADDLPGLVQTLRTIVDRLEAVVDQREGGVG